jgi:hypothetical protein
MTAGRAWPVSEEALAVTPPAAPAVTPPDAPPATYRYVPLLGYSLDIVVDDADGDYDARPVEAPAGPVKTCLPFLAPILQHPSWQLRITRASSTCVSTEIWGDFTIASTGEVTWTRPGWPVRRLTLSDEQRALVQRLDQLSCVELQPTDSEGDWLAIGLDLGKFQQYAGARIATASALARAITGMLDDLTEQYRRPRREVIGSMDLRLATRRLDSDYRVRVTGGRLTLKHGRTLLIDEPVEPDLLVDLVDTILERRVVEEPDVKGVLLMDGWSVPVTLGSYERGPFEQIHNAIFRAPFIEAERRELASTGIVQPRP